MVNPFYNSTERRVRAGWRIILQAGFFFLVSGLFAYLAMGAAGIFTAISGQAGGELWSNFFGIAANIINNNPFWRVVSLLGACAASVAALWLAGRLLDRRKLADFGFHLNRGWWLDLGFGLALGAVLMVIIFLVERAAGWVEITGTFYVRSGLSVPFWTVIAVGLLHYIYVGIQEEIFSRGYHLRNLAEGLKLPGISPRTAFIAAYAISSAMFGLFHLFNPNATLISTLNLMVGGLFLGLGYVLTRELAIPIGLHITWNFFQGRVFGFPVSGGTTSASLIAIRQLGPDIWTGGAFGPEAGILGLLAIALGCALTVLWVKWRTGQVRLQTDLAVYQQISPAGAEVQQVSEPLAVNQLP